MQVMYNHRWTQIPLDYTLGPGEISLSVSLFINLLAIDDAYFHRPADWRLVWNYLWEIGLVPTLTKVVSRRAEARRNDKYLSIGIGYIQQENRTVPVYFVAPLHPQGVDRLALSTALIKPLDQVPQTLSSLPSDQLRHLSLLNQLDTDTQTRLAPACGWSPQAGAPAPEIDWLLVARLVERAIQQEAPDLANPPRASVTRAGRPQPQGQRHGATLFGYGNYAKTVIIPNLPRQLQINRIHEIDPLQIPPKTFASHFCSSEPSLSADDTNKIFFIAGFHHTHAEIACAGLQRHGQVVVEKPLVTRPEQLAALEVALKDSRGAYFACFHKRYMMFNDWIRTDLNIDAHTPINYHAIVYEVPLPQKHWYRWPNSRSRIISNGCHWLDHFLYLNHFAAIDSCQSSSGRDGTLNISVTLVNGAFFTLVLTDTGSQRLGVQDYVELRQNGATVSIVNGATYKAENANRLVRQHQCSRMHSYGRMYRTIGKAIVDGQPGDTWQSIAMSAALALQVEAIANPAH